MLYVSEYWVVCVERSGCNPSHSHITQVGLADSNGGSITKYWKVKKARRRIKSGVRMWSADSEGHFARVRRYKCACGRKTPRTDVDDSTDDNLSAKPSCW